MGIGGALVKVNIKELKAGIEEIQRLSLDEIVEVQVSQHGELTITATDNNERLGRFVTIHLFSDTREPAKVTRTARLEVKK
jgi:sulfate adenylyltransferase subunit 1 (EFTu-like GTPase family)